jgi:DNA-binding transcriptional ArsR family regulator
MDVETQEMAVRQASVCGIFGNAKRVLILWALMEQEMSVSEIATAIEASLQNTSQHLRLMEDKGILVSYREGQKIYYGIVDHDLMKDCRLLRQEPQIRSVQEKGFEESS